MRRSGGCGTLDDWLAGERREILARAAAMRQAIGKLDGWVLRGCGAYFAYAEHPFALASDALAQRLVREAGVLLLPGTMFRPQDDPAGGARAAHRLRQLGQHRHRRTGPAPRRARSPPAR